MNLKGLVKDLSNNDYHSEKEHLSSSNLKDLLKNPEKFYKEKILGIKEPEVDKPHFAEGSYLHSLILEPDTIEKEYVFFDGWRKAGAEWKKFKDDLGDDKRTILSKPQKVKTDKLFQNYLKNETAVNMIKGIQPEVSLFTKIDGVGIKVRADALNIDDGYILDVKTTSFPADAESFKVTVDQFKYKLSAALYLKAFEAELGKKLDFYFLVVGKNDAACEIFKLSEHSRLEGDREVLEALRIYKKCKETNIWTKEEKCDSISYDDYEILEV